MTVERQNVSSGPYVANGVTTVFPFTFQAASIDEIDVELNGVVVDRSLYTVALQDDFTGSAAFFVAPTGTLNVFSDPDFTQEVNFENQGPFFQEDVNEPLDRAAKRDLYLLDAIKRSVRVARGEALAELPRADLRKNTLLGFTAAGALALLPIDTGLLPIPEVSANPIPVTSFRLPGDDLTHDNQAWNRCVAAVTNPLDPRYGRTPFLVPGMGRGTTDPTRPQYTAGAWIIDSFGQNPYQEYAGGPVLQDLSNTGNLASNLTVCGDVGTWVRRRESRPYNFYYNPAGNGTRANPSVISGDDPTGLKNVTFYKVGFENEPTIGFDELSAFINVNAVKDFRVIKCTFRGARGHDCFFGQGDVGGGTQNRININIQVWDNLFDGVDGTQSNAIAVSSCDGFIARYNRVRNHTRSTMPATFIDWEPETFPSNDDPYFLKIIMRNVDASFNDIRGGNAHAFSVFPPRSDIMDADAIGGFNIDCNYIRGGKSPLHVATDSAVGYEYDIRFRGNDVRYSNMCFFSRGVNGLEISGNWFRDTATFGEMGYELTPGVYERVRNGYVERNKFIRCGGSGLGAWVNTEWIGGRISDNDFIDCGGCGFSYWKESDHIGVEVSGNRFRRIDTSVKDQIFPIVVSTALGTPQIDPHSVRFASNDWGGRANYLLTATGAPVAQAPSTGAYSVGDELPNPYAAPNDIALYRATFTNTVDPPWFDFLTAPGSDLTVSTVGDTGWTFSSGMKRAGNGRFVSRSATGNQFAHMTTGIGTGGGSGGTGVEVIYFAGNQPSRVGMTIAATPAGESNVAFTVIRNSDGMVRLRDNTGTNIQTFGAAAAGTKIRWTFINGVLTVYTTNPQTGAEASLGSTYTNAAFNSAAAKVIYLTDAANDNTRFLKAGAV